MGMTASPKASLHFRKAAIMNAAMATNLSPTRLHALRFENGADNRARLIFNVRNGVHADDADNKLNLKPPGRVEYYPMVLESDQWTLYMSPGDGYIYFARKPGRKLKISQPSPLRECMTLGDGQDEIDMAPSPDAGTSKLHKTLRDHSKQIARHSKSALDRLRSQAAIEDSFAQVVNTESREAGNCKAAEQWKDATKR
ncbi:hypothetical protein LTR95_001273 [Oleoguttula sp. CCFEE 5521]